MGVSEIGFPQNVVYKQRIQTSDTLPVTIGASKYCEFLFDIDAGDRMTPLGIVGWGCDDKTQVFLLDFYMDNNLQTAKLILKNPYATSIAISSLYIDVLYSKQGLDMSEVDVVDNLTTDSAVAALSAKQGKVLNEKLSYITEEITDTTTSSGAILIPTRMRNCPIIDVHGINGYTGLVFRRDIGYFTCMTNTAVALANTSVTLSVTYLQEY